MIQWRQIARNDTARILKNFGRALKHRGMASCDCYMWPKERWGTPAVASDRCVLAKPITFPVATLISARNRFMKSAMSEQLCDFDKDHPEKSGIPSKELITLYKKFAEGGFGTIVTGSIMVNADEIEAPGNVIIGEKLDSPERKAAFQEWTAAGKTKGAVFLAQLFHPGLRSSDYTGKEKFDPGTVSKEKLEDLLDQFVYAALYAEQCGFNGVEISAAYAYTLGYLISENMNQRKDEYGGSFENRTRAIFRIIDGIRKKAKSNSRFVIGLKINAYNLAHGFNEADVTAFLKQAEERGVDYFTLTGGSFELLRDLDEEKVKALNQVDSTFRSVANLMKKDLAKTKLYLNGGFVTLTDMAEAVRKGWAHGISLGRPAAAEPNLPNKILNQAIDGAVKSLIDPADFPTSQQIAGIQLKQHGTNGPIMDQSNPEHIEKFKEVMAKHQQAIKDAPLEKPVIGYPKLVV